MMMGRWANRLLIVLLLIDVGRRPESQLKLPYWSTPRPGEGGSLPTCLGCSSDYATEASSHWCWIHRRPMRPGSPSSAPSRRASLDWLPWEAMGSCTWQLAQQPVHPPWSESWLRAPATTLRRPSVWSTATSMTKRTEHWPIQYQWIY